MVAVAPQNDNPEFESHSKQVNRVVVSVLSALEILTRRLTFHDFLLEWAFINAEYEPLALKMHNRDCAYDLGFL